VEPPDQHQLRAAAGETQQHPTVEKTKTNSKNHGSAQPAQAELNWRASEQLQAPSTNVDSTDGSAAAADADDADSGQRTAEAAIRTAAAVAVPVPGRDKPLGSSAGVVLGDEPKDGHAARAQLMRRAEANQAEANRRSVGSLFSVLQSVVVCMLMLFVGLRSYRGEKDSRAATGKAKMDHEREVRTLFFYGAIMRIRMLLITRARSVSRSRGFAFVPPEAKARIRVVPMSIKHFRSIVSKIQSDCICSNSCSSQT